MKLRKKLDVISTSFANNSTRTNTNKIKETKKFRNSNLEINL